MGRCLIRAPWSLCVSTTSGHSRQTVCPRMDLSFTLVCLAHMEPPTWYACAVQGLVRAAVTSDLDLDLDLGSSVVCFTPGRPGRQPVFPSLV